mmetsp:Transcript_5529/g.9429  ORF Transcript_5529/g.9429 Transcript_5529/m.9429 type:complete len:92 (+) Transcript_5529:51-326(+)|eukprot:CAMPEP_0168608156 /NCGR_PEP_ID=MMETSP0449_2-20121227/470_1 /TAXON_ID=1082188 /ORGANISM="Strombidium rassoulzadegani, Strain ras09" /LENGTH=91 /DNA_ID=CAMNT_0008648109 /DNA_START=51 /DNA_END=326 /DNA_ORIENTATION=-
MPTENMVHMFGGTKKKSTLVDERVIFFPREDESSPRQAILQRFCQDDLLQFRNCMTANDFNENNCLPTKGIVDKCAAAAFKNVNSDPELIF